MSFYIKGYTIFSIQTKKPFHGGSGSPTLIILLFLEKYGTIEKINLIVDGFTKRSRGFAFVYFDHMKDAIEAKESMDGQTLDGKQLKVDFSLTTEGHKRTPGN